MNKEVVRKTSKHMQLYVAKGLQDVYSQLQTTEII